MDCPVCNKPMKKIAWRITNNGKKGDRYTEYNKTNYNCESDDVWLEIEIPTMNSSELPK